MDSITYDTPDRIYELMQKRTPPPSWLRLLLRIRRVGDRESSVIGRNQCVVKLDPGGQPIIEYVDLLADGPDVIDFVEWADDDLDADDWVEGFLSIDRDGTRRTVLLIDPYGPNDDFLELDVPTWQDNYLEVHHDELIGLTH